jgi:hypothetical protein
MSKKIKNNRYINQYQIRSKLIICKREREKKYFVYYKDFVDMKRRQISFFSALLLDTILHLLTEQFDLAEM